MKKIYFLASLLIVTFTAQSQTFTWSPEFFSETDNSVTLTVSNFNPNTSWNVSDIYLWAWHIDENGTQINNPSATGTDFFNSPSTALFTNNGDGTYTFDFGIPSDFFNNNNIATIGFLIKSQNGTSQSSDFFKDVGVAEMNLSSPSNNSSVLISSGSNVTIEGIIEYQGANTNGGTMEVFLNGSNTAEASTLCGSPNCSLTLSNITSTTSVRVVGTPPAPNNNLSGEAFFNINVIPTVIEEQLPANLVEGINYDPIDPTIATLVLDAPFKDFVEVAGNFNNYNPSSSYVMKKDNTSGSTKFWLELSGLNPGQIYTYQYWVYDTNPISNSPILVKTADPYSTLVLSPFDDPFIPASTYPNLPTYPTGQEREVTVLQTNQTPYPWQVSNFTKPKKEDLVIYEVLVRDFDTNRNYQDLIDRIDYFKSLNINAIQLMPVMEFEGNESWGYNTSFHMALDKFYGTENKFKEFIDLCHQNGIAVILDIALNHAFGRNPLVRMWMNDPDGDGWGGPSTENPYFNVTPKHSFNVGSDFSHTEELPNSPMASSNDDTNPITNQYTRRVVKHWIEEFKIDGFRWDLTKGFTQNCSDGNDSCTNAYQQDRVDILRDYADYSWSLDEDHYVIFEHLGTDGEESQWANYRASEGKGIMMWGKMTSEYTALVKGSSSNISRATHQSRGFTEPRLIAYPESHDEERIMYDAVNFGNTSNSSHNVQNLDVALKRMASMGAINLTIPGPKMIWHFSSLGMDNSIWTCNNGSVQVGNDGCKLDTKPQPQWVNNWLADSDRKNVYDTWARLIDLKINEPVFEGSFALEGTTQNIRMSYFDLSLPSGSLRNVIILANFNVTDQNITPNFPFTGTWYNLMDDSSINITSTTNPITIPAGEFRIFGNQLSTLSNDDIIANNSISIYPNPTNTYFNINTNVSDVKLYDITGKLVKVFEGNFNTNEDFDITELKSGIYMVSLKNKDSQIQTSKLIKQ